MARSNKALAKRIGDVARDARLALRLTQQDVAEEIGITTEHYARIERGLALPGIDKLQRLAKALKVSADRLLGTEPAQVGGALVLPPEPRGADAQLQRRIQRRLEAADGITLPFVNDVLIATGKLRDSLRLERDDDRDA